MTTPNTFGRSLIAIGITAALSTTQLLAQDAKPQQGEQTTEELGEIVVTAITGSRTITDILKSPTPITSVDVAALALTTPSDTADALNKLPSIMGGRTPRNQGNGANNNGGNTLSLRNFGPQRTLVLLDGHRVAPNNQDGSVNIDVLPQMLVRNVDIVTGGASAVYGSDAVAGVVNYMLDKNFTGLTVKGDLGRSRFGDGDEYQLGAAWGTSLFSDRGHFEVSARTRHQDEILMKDRPGGENGQAWLQTGAGTVASPFQFTPFSRVYNSGQQGNVVCGSGCAFNNNTFDASGNLVPLAHGIPATPGNNIESGGSGAYIKYGTFRSELDSKDIFARFSLDLGENANWYVQGSWAQAENASDWIQMVVSPNNGRPNTLFANNPYLNPASRAALGGNLNCTTDLATPAARASRRCLTTTPTAPPTGGGGGGAPPGGAPLPPPPENNLIYGH
jgi:iron complex outermembrane receptor protein